MKHEINPVVAAIVLAVVALIAVAVLWHGTASAGGGKPPGAVGNPGPFSPGGAAVAKQTGPPTGVPAVGPQPGGATGRRMQAVSAPGGTTGR